MRPRRDIARGARANLVTLGLICLAALAATGLLFAYVHILDGAVLTGELRRITMADRARSVWRCNVLPLEAERRKCLLSAPL